MTDQAEPGTGEVEKPEPDKTDAGQEPGEKPGVDWKQKARDWESRAKANKDAADKLARIEEANKTEAQKLADAKAAAERERDEARAESLRWKIAAKHGVSDEDAELFLTGTDEDTLVKQAKRLTERTADQRKNGNTVRNEGTQNDGKALTGQAAEFANWLEQNRR